MTDKSFKKIVQDLRGASYTDTQIAKLCGCTKQHIGNIGKGETRSVGYSIGRRLVKLHEALK